MILRVFVSIAVLIQTPAFAYVVHPYSITEVHADIQDKNLRITIKTNAEDLLYFHELVLDTLFNITYEKLSEASQQHAQSIKNGFFVLDQHGKHLPSRIISTNFSSLEGRKVFNAMELGRYALYYILQFELADTTELLEFHQALSDAGIPAVSLLSISKNGTQLVKNIELSKEKAFSMNRWAMILGRSDAPVFLASYFSITDTRITHELTLPFALLKSFVTLNGQTADSFVATFHDFIHSSSAVEVNNTVLTPEITTLDFQTDSESPQHDTLLVNVRIHYSLRVIPKDVAISWNTFTWQVRWFKSVIDVFHEKAEHNFSRFQPTFKTSRSLPLNKESH